MLSLILGFITGLAGPVSAVINNITNLKLAQEQTKSNIERAKIGQEIAEAEGRKAVLVAEAGNRVASAINASVRLVLTVGPAAILLKLMLWDKVIGSLYGCTGKVIPKGLDCSSFRTDELDVYQWSVITAVIAFYFMYDIANRIKK